MPPLEESLKEASKPAEPKPAKPKSASEKPKDPTKPHPDIAYVPAAFILEFSARGGVRAFAAVGISWLWMWSFVSLGDWVPIRNVLQGKTTFDQVDSYDALTFRGLGVALGLAVLAVAMAYFAWAPVASPAEDQAKRSPAAGSYEGLDFLLLCIVAAQPVSVMLMTEGRDFFSGGGGTMAMLAWTATVASVAVMRGLGRVTLATGPASVPAGVHEPSQRSMVWVLRIAASVVTILLAVHPYPAQYQLLLAPALLLAAALLWSMSAVLQSAPGLPPSHFVGQTLFWALMQSASAVILVIPVGLLGLILGLDSTKPGITTNLVAGGVLVCASWFIAVVLTIGGHLRDEARSRTQSVAAARNLVVWVAVGSACVALAGGMAGYDFQEVMNWRAGFSYLHD